MCCCEWIYQISQKYAAAIAEKNANGFWIPAHSSQKKRPPPKTDWGTSTYYSEHYPQAGKSSKNSLLELQAGAQADSPWLPPPGFDKELPET